MIWIQAVITVCGIIMAIAIESWIGKIAGIILAIVGTVGLILAKNRNRTAGDKHLKS